MTCVPHRQRPCSAWSKFPCLKEITGLDPIPGVHDTRDDTDIGLTQQWLSLYAAHPQLQCMRWDAYLYHINGVPVALEQIASMTAITSLHIDGWWIHQERSCK